MQKRYLIPVLLFVTLSAHAQQQIEWQKNFGGSNYDNALFAVQTSDGGYFCGGNTQSNNGDVSGFHFNTDEWLFRLDAQGTLQWQKCLGGSHDESAEACQQLASGRHVIAGFSSSYDNDVPSNNGSDDVWVYRLDSSDNFQWNYNYGGTLYEHAHDIRRTSDGGYIMAGVSTSDDIDVTKNNGSFDYWIIKVDSNGLLQWQKSYGGSNWDEAESVVQGADGGYLVVGWSNSNDSDVTGNHGSWDYWLVKLDSAGNLEWQKSYGGSVTDEAQYVDATADGGYIVAGYTFSNDGDVVTGNHGYCDYWILKLDASGAIQWQECYGGEHFDIPYAIHQTSDGGYIMAGTTHSTGGDVTGNHGYYDYWIVKIDDIGFLQWEKCFGGGGDDEAHSIEATADGGYIISGYSDSNDGDLTGNHGLHDCWIVKLGYGTGMTNNISSGIKLYPDPAQHELSLTMSSEFQLEELEVFDILGKKYLDQTFLRSPQTPVTIKVSDLAEGVYEVRIKCPGGIGSAKFIKQ